MLFVHKFIKSNILSFYCDIIIYSTIFIFCDICTNCFNEIHNEINFINKFIHQINNQNKKDKMEMTAELSKSENCLNVVKHKSIDYVDNMRDDDDMTPPPVPPLPINYQRSDGMY